MRERMIREIMAEVGGVATVDARELESAVRRVASRYEVRMRGVRDALGGDAQRPDYARLFLEAKRLEGASEKTLRYYESTISRALAGMEKSAAEVATEDVRAYLTRYGEERGASRGTLDNIRRVLSSFFRWLEDEDYVVKSPVRRIKKVKGAQRVKETYGDETLEELRDASATPRDLAMIDLLASSGMRVGELVALNRSDVNFQERECLVFGKGSKERLAYFDARTKIHLQAYLSSRVDDAPALFVSLKAPWRRLMIGGVEARLRALGKRLNLEKVHPHKFRRTMATNAIEKGMPIELLQKLLGHQKINSTMHYAIVKQQNVKFAHQKFMG